MLHCLSFCPVDSESIFYIPNSFENQDPYVRAKNWTIFKLYQEAKTLIFQMSHLTLTTYKFPVVFHPNNITQAHKCIVNNGTHVKWLSKSNPNL